MDVVVGVLGCIGLPKSFGSHLYFKSIPVEGPILTVDLYTDVETSFQPQKYMVTFYFFKDCVFLGERTALSELG